MWGCCLLFETSLWPITNELASLRRCPPGGNLCLLCINNTPVTVRMRFDLPQKGPPLILFLNPPLLVEDPERFYRSGENDQLCIFFARPKKTNQKKGRPVPWSFGLPCASRTGLARKNSPAASSGVRQFACLIDPVLRCSAAGQWVRQGQ